MPGLEGSPSIIIAGIPVWDEGTEEEFVRIGTGSAVRTLVCMWNDRIRLAQAMLGNITNIAGINVIDLAMAYPGASWLYADKFKPVGVVGNDGLKTNSDDSMIEYKYARCTVTYAPLPFDPTDMGSDGLDFGIELAALPSSIEVFKWTSDNVAVPASDTPAIRIGCATISRVRRYADLPLDTVLPALGKVNGATYRGITPGKLLFDGASAYRLLTSYGASMWTLQYRILYKSVGWNTIYRPSTNSFETVAGIGSGQPPYPTTDFSFLTVV